MAGVELLFLDTASAAEPLLADALDASCSRRGEDIVICPSCGHESQGATACVGHRQLLGSSFGFELDRRSMARPIADEHAWTLKIATIVNGSP